MVCGRVSHAATLVGESPKPALSPGASYDRSAILLNTLLEDLLIHGGFVKLGLPTHHVVGGVTRPRSHHREGGFSFFRDANQASCFARALRRLFSVSCSNAVHKAK